MTLNALDSSIPQLSMGRRDWLRAAVAGLGGLGAVGCTRRLDSTAETTPPDAPMRFPGKVPMRVLNDRPPLLETPWNAFRHDLTPNDSFYVRWHLELIPTRVDPRSWRLAVRGRVERPLDLSLADLRRFEPVSIVAVNQCSGNSRALFEPRIPGAQWVHGAMGNARWTGVRLRDILDRAGVQKGAVEVAFDGLDQGPLPTVPDFIKALAIDHARSPEVLVAYAMNDQTLPLLNGFPVRLVVPGWFATYWVKSLASITVLDRPFQGYWMSKAYRIPTTAHAQESPQSLAQTTVPISRMSLRSFLVSPVAGEHLPIGRPTTLEGIAFDGGDGVRQVEVSHDGGANWAVATLGPDLGPYSFRRFRLDWTPTRPGVHTLAVRATSRSGETQPETANWNRGGYLRNVVERLEIIV